jgi:hypothetical protein
MRLGLFDERGVNDLTGIISLARLVGGRVRQAIRDLMVDGLGWTAWGQI